MNSVYIVENTKNNKLYVGVTTKTPDKRFREHCINAKCGLEYALHHSIRKYGEKTFEVNTLERFESKEKAFKAEQKWIKLFNTYEGTHGYNLTEGGDCGPIMKGRDNPMYGRNRTFSKETKQKMSESHTGRSMSEEHKERIAKANTGKTYSKERKQNISESHKGKTLSEKHKKNISKGLEKSDNSELKSDQAAEIKWLINNTDKSQREIAENYPIGHGAVSSIKNQKTWSYVDPKNPN